MPSCNFKQNEKEKKMTADCPYIATIIRTETKVEELEKKYEEYNMKLEEIRKILISMNGAKLKHLVDLVKYFTACLIAVFFGKVIT